MSTSEWSIKMCQRLNKRKFLCHLNFLHILNSSCSQFTVLFPQWNSVALSPCRTIVAAVVFIWMKTLLKLWKMLFISTWKLFQFLRYLIFYPHFCSHVEKRLDKKAKVNFKSYNFINWETNNQNILFAQYFKTQRQ